MTAGGVSARPEPPTPRFLGLGSRLALGVTLAVTGVMASVSGVQLLVDFQTEQRERAALLAVSLPPLVAQLQKATTPEDARGVLARFHGSYLEGGHAHHYISVVDAAGRVLLEAGDEQGTAPARLTASAPLSLPGLLPEGLSVIVTQGGADLSEERSGRWRAWAVHVGLTALLILSLLFFVIRREVTAPVERLLRSIRKMELGYWDDMPDPGGAWELRWLAWRFRCLAEEQSATLQHLLAAHRRAYASQASASLGAASTRATSEQAAGLSTQDQDGEMLRTLEARLLHLRGTDPADPAADMSAMATWTFEAQEAERAGYPLLRARLEDAALRLLEPDEFIAIERDLAACRPHLESQAGAFRAGIEAALALKGIPVVGLTCRIKRKRPSEALLTVRA